MELVKLSGRVNERYRPAKTGPKLGHTCRIALIRHHDLCLNTRQIQLIQKRAGVLPHLGLGYIQTVLQKKGFDVRQFDTPALGLNSDGLRAALAAYAPDIAGVSTTTPGLPGAIEACQAAKSTGALVILGGPHTEVYGVQNLYHSCIDYVGVGEGASVMPALALAVQNGEEPVGIPGLISRDYNGGVAPMQNIEDIGWPERDGLPMSNYYSIMSRRPFATMISSRGCPFKCSFCFKQAVDKSSIFRSPEDVVGEMEYLTTRWGVKEIMFYDDVFTLKRSRVFEICDLIRRRGLKVRWEAPTRVDLVPRDLLKAMAAAGCIRLRFGIESGDPEILKRMRKESDVAVIEEAVRNAKEAGIKTFGYFIVGYLGETYAQYQNTLNLVQKIPLDYASFYTATPLPGTQLHSEAVAAGLVAADYWDRFVRGEFDARVGFLAPDAQGRTREAYRQFYFRAKMIEPIMRHMLRTGQVASVLKGLMSLSKSSSNTERDF